jgi:hypothetical protein
VYKSHCCAFGAACEDVGYEVKYLFSQEYAWMLTEEIRKKTFFIGQSSTICSMLKDRVAARNLLQIKTIFCKEKPSHVYLHNYHLLNHIIADHCHKNGGKFIIMRMSHMLKTKGARRIPTILAVFKRVYGS